MPGLVPDLPRSDHFGLLAEYNTPGELYRACEKIRDAGFTDWDAHCPFPVHGLDKAMGIPQSILPRIVLAGAMLGAGGGLLMQWWMSSQGGYPLVISGKPLFSWPAFIPVTFALGILGGVFGSVFGMLALNQLPQFYHPLFNSERFKAVTDDKFFISIVADDPKYDREKTMQLLKDTGAAAVEFVEND